MKKGKTFISVFSFLAVFCVVILVIGLVVMLVNNGQKSFYVQYGNSEIAGTTNGVALPADTYSLFYCKNVLGGAVDYTVSVVPKADKIDFDFKVNGQSYSFGSERDLTSGFNIACYDGYFAIFISKDTTMQTILQRVYSEYEVTDVPEIDLTKHDLFTFIVKAENEAIYISFHLEV